VTYLLKYCDVLTYLFAYLTGVSCKGRPQDHHLIPHTSLGKWLKHENRKKRNMDYFRDCFLDAPDRTENWEIWNETPGIPWSLSGFVSISPLEVGGPKWLVLAPGFKAKWSGNKNSDLKRSTSENLWRPRTSLRFLPTFCACRSHLCRPTFRTYETKYPAGWREEQRAKPSCFVSRNQKRPGGRIGAFFVSLFVFYVSFFLCSDFDPFDGRDPTLLVYTEPDTY